MVQRILHIGLDTHMGGIETYLLKIATYVDKSRYEFAFLMYDDEKPCFYDELTAMGWKFYNVTSRRKNFLKNRRDLKHLFKTERFDYIHCHLNSLSYIAPVTIALDCGCKVIVHSRNAGAISSFKSKILHKVNYYRLPKKKIRCAAVSDLAGKWMFGEQSSFVVLNNGLDVEKYKFSESSREKIRKELNLENHEVILHTGAFRTQKNHTFLIDLFNAYLKKNATAVLILVGEGSLKESIQEKVEKLGIGNSVIFTGVRRDIPELLSAADKFLFPSFYEGFPNALIEAEASGLYCICSDTITTQVRIPEQCRYISLNAPIAEWVKELNNTPNYNRMNSGEWIKKMGLDIDTEMERLYQLYQG